MPEESALQPIHIKKLLDRAKKYNFFDYVAFKTMILLDIHGATLVGQSDRRPGMFPNPGMLIENLTPEGIYLYEIHSTERVFKPISNDLRAEINRVIGNRTKGKIFPRTRAWLWERLRFYAKKSGITQRIGGNELNAFSETYKPFLSTVIENPMFFEHQSKDPRATSRRQKLEPETRDPRDVLEKAFVTLKRSLSDEILTRLKSCSPRFFEENVLELLVKMGYGSREDAQITGRTGDEGIDGIIQTDKLGLRVLAFQAKRWSIAVGASKVRDFVGSLDPLRAREGIFFATSHFSNEAEEWSKKTEKKIVLIDGERLARLMIDHDVGVDTEKTLVVKRLKKEYFE